MNIQNMKGTSMKHIVKTSTTMTTLLSTKLCWFQDNSANFNAMDLRPSIIEQGYSYSARITS